MNEYIVKIGKYYYEGEKEYNLRGYLDKQHPHKTIKLTKFDFKAVAFDEYEDAKAVAERCKNSDKSIEILKIHKGLTVDSVKYFRSDNYIGDVMREEQAKVSQKELRKALGIAERTYYKIMNGFASDVYISIVIKVCKELMKRGYKEVELYLQMKKEQEYRIKREKGWL